MIIINAENLLVGRMSTLAAKKLLLGEEVVVVNCEKAMISGRKHDIIKKYRQKLQRGSVRKGPFISKSPAMLVKRMIRGMIPFKLARGKTAFKRLKCYSGVPPEHIKSNMITIENVNVSKLPHMNFMSMGYISKELGGIK
jgi:large subunit ribosomal protein L13